MLPERVRIIITAEEGSKALDYLSNKIQCTVFSLAGNE